MRDAVPRRWEAPADRPAPRPRGCDRGAAPQSVALSVRGSTAPRM